MPTPSTRTPILLSPPHMGGDERGYIDDAFRTNWLAPLGPNVEGFEREMSDALGATPQGPMHALATSSGTAAIHLGLILLGVKPGDVVLCSSFTFVASANPIRQMGAEPVFVDSDNDSWNMSPLALRRAIETLHAAGRTPKACIAVDLYGQGCEYSAIEALCDEWSIPILEDAAESLGASVHGRSCGTFGRLAALSFNGNKIITTTGGGMLVSNDRTLIDRARFLATQAREPAPHYEHTTAGFNYRMSNVLAGIGRGQLNVLRERVAARRANFLHYELALSQRPGVRFMPQPLWSRSTHWLTALTLDPTRAPCTRDELIEALAAEGIESRPTWKPMHLQPLFAGTHMFPHDPSKPPVCERLFAQGICLPSGSSLTQADLCRVVECVDHAFASARVTVA